jgi:hypothetical protein
MHASVQSNGFNRDRPTCITPAEREEEQQVVELCPKEKSATADGMKGALGSHNSQKLTHLPEQLELWKIHSSD